MNQIAVITPVPDVIDTLITNSILRKAVERNAVKFHIVNLRQFGRGNYRQIDDTPFGGGSGMVMMAEPLIKAIEQTMDLIGGSEDVQVIYPSPQGETWCQTAANQTSKVKKLIVICGHYKGIDERVIDRYSICEYSLGDFVITSGEIPAMVMVDSAVRLIPGALNTLDSALTDTFTHDLLDHPHYTQPREIEGLRVPDVLLSGHHKEIETWKQGQREKRTKERRPDLWKTYKEKLKESETNYE
ncbi:MAG: tRNA (guanosine(37)-N1)-methyltransferase TrmD [Candidatus Marinimicrobia bacterium]|nr:tRNA (guanosine(37)-N1)-methyltransferase TrmD [Candidatus Neomarinimicrobiota bacterium]MDP6613565.1 tRNA (guanosine(37)-N1)-methyltransferase TrmD [Candidatus Neomarinimicrobiota bacterium]